MADVELWGLRTGGHATSNSLLHCLTTILLLLALERLTGSIWPSAAVATLFAIHPMHVESVAWISERKDTLRTLFGVLAILIYAVRRPPLAIACVTAAFAASLLAKQMLVTLPFILLLLDFWREAAEQLREAARIDAAKANRYLTGILRMPPADSNLQRTIEQLEQ
ncbi:MAG: hypothetical protein JJE51_05795 [Thermoanaerobaculia bacterium]|nr:hypothetical protein [Thermoanaerobaculia bacterium]